MLVNDIITNDDINTYNLDTEDDGYWTDEDKEDFADSHEEDGDWMDGDALASAGWGTDEDYGWYGDDFQCRRWGAPELCRDLSPEINLRHAKNFPRSLCQWVDV